jgi:hypothetical protein
VGGFSSFHPCRSKARRVLGPEVVADPRPPAPAQTINVVCGICEKVITEGEPTVKIRHGGTSKDPIQPLLAAHSSCFRAELLPRW